MKLSFLYLIEWFIDCFHWYTDCLIFMQNHSEILHFHLITTQMLCIIEYLASVCKKYTLYHMYLESTL